MSITAINAPLAALFGLAYGMGHPAVAPYRPAMVDKTLASFHNDINRTAKDINDGLTKLVLARTTLTDASASKVASVKIPKTPAFDPPVAAHARGAMGLPFERRISLTEPERRPAGFTVLQAR